MRCMIDGETVPDGRVNVAFDLDALGRHNVYLQSLRSNLEKSFNNKKALEEQWLLEKTRNRLQLGPFMPAVWQKLDEEFGI